MAHIAGGGLCYGLCLYRRRHSRTGELVTMTDEEAVEKRENDYDYGDN